MSASVDAGAWLQAVRARRPLVHNITNLVVTNVAANALLAVGASPVMAHARQEVADMARMSAALTLNMGTLDGTVVEAMRIAGRAANQAGVPVVFDPVGVGATPYRSEIAAALADELEFAVLRGNGGEIGYMLGIGGEVKGVDSVAVSERLPQAMREYARGRGTVVVATGETDYVTDGSRIWVLSNGHPLLSAITGSGCMLTALIGAFAGAAGELGAGRMAEAAVAALTCYNVAAELAAAEASGPGTFQAALFDALHRLDPEEVNRRANVRVMGDEEP